MPKRLFAQITFGPGLLDGLIEPGFGEIVFPPDVDEAFAGPHRKAGNGYALQDLMGVALHDVTVLDGPRFPFIGVADDIFGGDGEGPGEGPLEAGRESGAAPAANPGGLDFLHHRLRGHGGHRLFEIGVPSPGQIGIDAVGVDMADVIQHHQLLGALLILKEIIGAVGQLLIVRSFPGPVIGQHLLDFGGGQVADHHLIDLHGRGDFAHAQAGR